MGDIFLDTFIFKHILYTYRVHMFKMRELTANKPLLLVGESKAWCYRLGYFYDGYRSDRSTPRNDSKCRRTRCLLDVERDEVGTNVSWTDTGLRRLFDRIQWLTIDRREPRTQVSTRPGRFADCEMCESFFAAKMMPTYFVSPFWTRTRTHLTKVTRVRGLCLIEVCYIEWTNDEKCSSFSR